MHVVTFYSYKGGVGRTMALVNTGVALAMRGRRVLLVDFDLEAPGLPTYPEFQLAADRPGIVDFVHDFLSTNEAPLIDDYLVECNIGEDVQPLFVMSAGKQDANYATKLASIDWKLLYEERDGYLLFNDLREQWRNAVSPAFDYVLVDSRTGLTDVGGICTRQLPSAVVLMFLPTDQNIMGVKVIADAIRGELSRKETPVNLLFCASNVPDLDDEHTILRDQLDKAKTALQYDSVAAILSHYNSLDLLTQQIFVRDRPRTKLATEYRSLADKVIATNFEDRDGAIASLRSIRSASRLDARSIDLIEHIQKLHPDDGEVASNLAAIYRGIGDLESERDALDVAISKRFRVASAKRARAQNLLSRGQVGEAVDDLREILKEDDATPADIMLAVDLLHRHDKDWCQIVEGSQKVTQLDIRSKSQLANRLMTDREGATIARKFYLETLRASEQSDSHLANQLILSLIGARRFEEALSTLGISRATALTLTDIVSVFNYSIALWGTESRPDIELLRHVLAISEQMPQERPDANYFQCIALCHAAVANREAAVQNCALALRRLGPGSIFSCWRYLNVGQQTMRRDIADIEKAAATSIVKPLFLS